MEEIKKQIHKELDSYLDEIDIESEISRLLDPEKMRLRVKKVIDSLIQQRVAETIESSIISAISKNKKVFEPFVLEKVYKLVGEIRETIQKGENDGS